MLSYAQGRSSCPLCSWLCAFSFYSLQENRDCLHQASASVERDEGWLCLILLILPKGLLENTTQTFLVKYLPQTNVQLLLGSEAHLNVLVSKQILHQCPVHSRHPSMVNGKAVRKEVLQLQVLQQKHNQL